MNSLLELFCDVDGFCKEFLPKWQQLQLCQRLDLASATTIFMHE